MFSKSAIADEPLIFKSIIKSAAEIKSTEKWMLNLCLRSRGVTLGSLSRKCHRRRIYTSPYQIMCIFQHPKQYWKTLSMALPATCSWVYHTKSSSSQVILICQSQLARNSDSWWAGEGPPGGNPLPPRSGPQRSNQTARGTMPIALISLCFVDVIEFFVDWFIFPWQCPNCWCNILTKLIPRYNKSSSCWSYLDLQIPTCL